MTSRVNTYIEAMGLVEGRGEEIAEEVGTRFTNEAASIVRPRLIGLDCPSPLDLCGH